MNEPRCDKNVSWLELSRSDIRFCRCAAGMLADNRCDMDCRLYCVEAGREKDSGLDEALVENVVDARLLLNDWRFVCSSNL